MCDVNERMRHNYKHLETQTVIHLIYKLWEENMINGVLPNAWMFSVVIGLPHSFIHLSFYSFDKYLFNSYCTSGTTPVVYLHVFLQNSVIEMDMSWWLMTDMLKDNCNRFLTLIVLLHLGKNIHWLSWFAYWV